VRKAAALFSHRETKGTKVESMLETITTTASSVSSFVNTTFALAASAGFVFDNNATEFLNLSVDANLTTDPCDAKNPNFNCTVDEYLSLILGAKQMPLETAIWVSICGFGFGEICGWKIVETMQLNELCLDLSGSFLVSSALVSSARFKAKRGGS
jgi:hypothetical protein